MASLLDTLRNNMTQPAQKQGVSDTTNLAATLQRAKSGKAVAPGMAMSNLGEQAAVQATNAELGQAQQQGQLAAVGAEQQAENIASQGQQQITEVGQQRTGNQIQSRLQTNQLFNELESSGKELDLQKDRAKLEQLATNLALQDKKYVANLQQEGAKKRLNDKTAFADEVARTSLGNGLDIFKQQLGNKSIAGASNREFSKALAEMDINAAMEMAKQSAKAQSTAQKYGALGGLASAGISYASRPSDSTAEDTSDEGEE